jgi:hypothetical protein
MSKPIPCFVHVPKTAGSSIRTLITLNYLPSEVASIYGDYHGIFERCFNLIGRTDGYKLLQGHMPYGVHLNVGLKAARYFFFLRHPVDRHFSDTAHGARNPKHGFHAQLTAPGSGPAKWATIADHIIYYRNTATHYLSGVFFTRDVDMTNFHRAAQAVIESEFVGLAERFNESVLIMARKLGWSNVIYEKRNVGPNAMKPLFTPELRKAAEDRLLFDMALYQIARERFEEDARSYGAHLQEAAHQLEELVALQSKTCPELENREYLVGDPVSTQETLSRTYPADSPLELWLKSNNANPPRSRKSVRVPTPASENNFVKA